jgi:hypothetical protein
MMMKEAKIETSIEDLTLMSKINEYLALRSINDTNNQSNINIKPNNKKVDKKESSFFDMVKPSGWFRDEAEIELQARMDSNIPLIPHPLSFSELQKYGYESLSSHIMNLGSPHVVGQAVGIPRPHIFET